MSLCNTCKNLVNCMYHNENVDICFLYIEDDFTKITDALENCVACFVDDGGLCFPVFNDDLDEWHFSWVNDEGLEYSVDIPVENFENAKIVDRENGIFEVKDKNGYNTKIQILAGMKI